MSGDTVTVSMPDIDGDGCELVLTPRPMAAYIESLAKAHAERARYRSCREGVAAMAAAVDAGSPEGGLVRDLGRLRMPDGCRLITRATQTTQTTSSEET
jgi:hypothetical protein